MVDVTLGGIVSGWCRGIKRVKSAAGHNVKISHL